jgi:hypothetical protein
VLNRVDEVAAATFVTSPPEIMMPSTWAERNGCRSVASPSMKIAGPADAKGPMSEMALQEPSPT